MPLLRQYSYASYEAVPVTVRSLFTIAELAETRTCPDPAISIAKLFEGGPGRRRDFPWVSGRRPCDRQAKPGILKLRVMGLPEARKPRKLRAGGLRKKLRATR